MSEWISVEDMVPDAGTDVILYYTYEVIDIADAYYYEGGNNTPYLNEEVTHWMPLPSPPND